MKKLIITLTLSLVFTTLVSAQTSYKSALGLTIDFVDNATFVGPGGKYFFSANHVGEASLGFENDLTLINILYAYHKSFPGAPGLRWYVGGGPAVIFREDISNLFALRPYVGLDFKIGGVPLAFSFDWKPYVFMSDVEDTIEAGAFSLSFRYAFN